jgi:hypothetical protein
MTTTDSDSVKSVLGEIGTSKSSSTLFLRFLEVRGVARSGPPHRHCFVLKCLLGLNTRPEELFSKGLPERERTVTLRRSGNRFVPGCNESLRLDSVPRDATIGEFQYLCHLIHDRLQSVVCVAVAKSGRDYLLKGLGSRWYCSQLEKRETSHSSANLVMSSRARTTGANEWIDIFE